MIEAVKIDDIGIDLSVNGNTAFKHEMATDTFSELKVRITNRTNEPINPLLRLQPSLRNQSHNVSLDLSKKLVWNGILQQTLPPLAGKDSIEIIFGVTALARGEFDIGASVEETVLKEEPKKEGKSEGGGRPRANTRTMMDAVLGARERRIWHTRETCRVVVRDEDSDDEADDDRDE